jgi:hypothetical protein
MPLNNPVMDFDEFFRKELLMRSITHLCQMACDLLWQPAGE